MSSFQHLNNFFTRSKFHFISRSHLLCSSITHKQHLILWSFLGDCSNSFTCSGSTSNSPVLLPDLKHLQSWTPASSSMTVGTNVSQTPVNVEILISFLESGMFLMPSRMVNPFQKVFDWLFQDPFEESLFMVPIALGNISLKNKTWNLKWFLDPWSAEWIRLCY